MSGKPGDGRRYGIELAGVILGYGVLLTGSIILLRLIGDAPLRWLVALLPVPAVAGIIWVVIRQLRRSDELQSRISVEAMAIGFAIGSLVTFTYGFLQLAGAPQVSWFFVWPVYAAGWLIGLAVARRRY